MIQRAERSTDIAHAPAEETALPIGLHDCGLNFRPGDVSGRFRKG